MLTSSSVLSSIEIIYSLTGYPQSIKITDDNGDNHYINLNVDDGFQDKNPASDSQLAILRTLFEASSITPTLVEYPAGITYSNMEEWGYINPLDSASYTRWEISQKASAMQGHSTIEQDSASGKYTQKTAHNIEPKATVSDDGNVDTDLTGWYAAAESDTAGRNFSLSYEWDRSSEIASGGIDDTLVIRGLRNLLEDWNATNTVFGTALATASSWTGRNVSSGDVASDAVWQVTDVETEYLGNDLVRFTLKCQSQTSNNGTVLVQALNQYLWGKEQAVATTEAKLETKIGSPKNLLYAKGLLGENALLEMNNGIPTLRTREYKTRIGAGDGRTAKFIGLPNVSTRTDGNTKRIPINKSVAYWNTDVIEYTGDGGTDRLQPENPKLARYDGQHAKWEVHNTGTGNLDIVDPEDETIVLHTLRPTQDCEFLMLKEPDGVGRIIFTRTKPRFLIFNDGSDRNMDLTQTLTESGYKNMPLPMFEGINPATHVDNSKLTYDRDAFEFGTTSIDDGDGDSNWTTRTSWNHDRSFKLLWPGQLFLFFSMNLKTRGSPSASNSGTNRPRWLGMLEGGDRGDATEIALVQSPSWSDESPTYNISRAMVSPLDLPAGRWIQGFYNRNNGGYDEDELVMAGVNLSCIFLPQIEKEYT